MILLIPRLNDLGSIERNVGPVTSSRNVSQELATICIFTRNVEGRFRSGYARLPLLGRADEPHLMRVAILAQPRDWTSSPHVPLYTEGCSA